MGINAHIRENSKNIETSKSKLKVVQYGDLILNEKLLKRVARELKNYEYEIVGDKGLKITYETGSFFILNLQPLITDEFKIPIGDLDAVL